MTAAVATWAASDQGKLAAGTCRVWGIDPASFIPDDDVLGFALRVLLAGRLTDDQDEPEPRTLAEGWERAGEQLHREVYG